MSGRKTNCHFCDKMFGYDDLYDVLVCHECADTDIPELRAEKERLEDVLRNIILSSRERNESIYEWLARLKNIATRGLLNRNPQALQESEE